MSRSAIGAPFVQLRKHFRLFNGSALLTPASDIWMQKVEKVIQHTIR